MPFPCPNASPLSSLSHSKAQVSTEADLDLSTIKQRSTSSDTGSLTEEEKKHDLTKKKDDEYEKEKGTNKAMEKSALQPDMLDELYKRLGGKRLFNIQNLRYNYDQMIALWNTRGHGECKLKNVIGEEHELPDVFRKWYTYDAFQTVYYFSYQGLCDPISIWGDVSDPQEKGIKSLARALIEPYVFPVGRGYNKHIDAKILKRREEEWKNSPDRERMMTAISKAEVRINKIVCFGQGSLDVSCREVNPACNLEHHLVAFDFAERLQDLYGSDEAVPIYFQDPIYNDEDKQYLSQGMKPKWKVFFPQGVEGFEAIDENTLVLAHGSPTFPIRQIVADITVEYNGPAAIFCTKVKHADCPEQFSISEEIRSHDRSKANPVNRHVIDMLQHYTAEFEHQWGRTALSTLYLKKKETTGATLPAASIDG